MTILGRGRGGLGGGQTAALAVSFALNLLMLIVPLYSFQVYTHVLGGGQIAILLILNDKLQSVASVSRSPRSQ